MRKRLFEIIEVAEEGDKWSNFYDFFMMGVILVSLIPLAFKEQTVWMDITDKVTVAIFIVDYLLRFITADLKLKKL